MSNQMANEASVRDTLERIWEGRNLTHVFPECLDLLVANTGEGRALSFDDGPPQLWLEFTSKLFELRAFDHTIVALEALYRLQCEEQQSLGRRYHKGFALHNIGAACLALGRSSMARRYVYLAHIEDVLTGGVGAKDMAHAVLYGILGVPLGELDELSGHASRFRTPSPNPHPEDVLLAFQEERKQSRESEARLFRPNLVFARKLFDEVDGAKTKANKGLALERLVAHLLTSITGIELAEFRQPAKDHETDLLIRNAIQADPLFEVFGPYLGVECKNWDRSVGVREVNHFIANLRFAYLKAGILVARNGISGGTFKERRNAELVVLKAFHQDNVIVCIITRADLEAVIEGRVTMPGLLLSEYERIRFDKTAR